MGFILGFITGVAATLIALPLIAKPLFKFMMKRKIKNVQGMLNSKLGQLQGNFQELNNKEEKNAW